MAKPAYSLDNINWTTLPGAWRYGGEPRSRVDSAIVMEADSGATYAYLQSGRKVWELHFRVGDTDLDAFEDLHLAVNGIVTPFFFGFKTGSYNSPHVPPPIVYTVRKEMDFRPVEMDQILGDEAGYDYVLKLQEEVG